MHVVEGRARELWELVSARQQLQRKRVALSNTVRGYLHQEGHRLPAKFFGSPTWRAQLERVPLSGPLTLILETFRGAIEALTTAERHLTDRLQAIRDPRCALLETIPAIGPVSARVLVSALDDAGGQAAATVLCRDRAAPGQEDRRRRAGAQAAHDRLWSGEEWTALRSTKTAGRVGGMTEREPGRPCSPLMDTQRQ